MQHSRAPKITPRVASSRARLPRCGKSFASNCTPRNVGRWRTKVGSCLVAVGSLVNHFGVAAGQVPITPPAVLGWCDDAIAATKVSLSCSDPSIQHLWKPAMPLLSDSSLDNDDTRVYASPFAFLVAENQLPEAQYAALEADFPKYHGAGFFPYDPADCGEGVQQLVAELTAPAFADRIGQHLGVPNLGRYPTLVTLCRSLNKRDRKSTRLNSSH